MPRDKNFKGLVRGRMAKTGESYTTARSHLRTRVPDATGPTGGTDPDAAALARALAAAGVVDPATGRPLSPHLLFGTGGGIGFAYLVFAYPGWTNVHVDGRFNALYFEKAGFAETACARLGVRLRVQQLSTVEIAERRLGQALEVGGEVMLTLDLVRLPGHTPPVPAPYVPHHVTVTGDGDALTVTGLTGGPVVMSLREVVEARWTGAKKYGGLFTVEAPGPAAHNLPVAIKLPDVVAAATRRTAECLLEPSRTRFDGSFGVGGIRKWARLLTDDRDAKGWPRLFPDPDSRLRALASVARGLGGADPATAGARWFYAAFLAETGYPAAAVEAYRDLGRRWAALAALAASPDATGADLASHLPGLADAEESAARALLAGGPR